MFGLSSGSGDGEELEKLAQDRFFWFAKAGEICEVCGRGFYDMSEEQPKVKDSNGNLLQDGDSVTVIKDLKVKGSSQGLKRGTLIKNIRLIDDDPEHIECNAPKIKGLVLKTCFLKKA